MICHSTHPLYFCYSTLPNSTLSNLFFPSLS